MIRSRKPRKHVIIRLRQKNKRRANYSFTKGGVL